MKSVANEIFFEHVEALIADGESVRLSIRGNSMRPWLRDGRHEVIVAPHSDGDLKKGAIVLFRCDGRHILHRIRRRTGRNLVLAGDGNCGTTEHCTTDDVAAVAVAVVTRKGRIIRCSSPVWRLKSACWLMLPTIVRRYVLALLWKTGCR